MTNDILSNIIAHKRVEIAALQKICPTERLRERLSAYQRPVLSMSQALRTSDTGIIAEFKRKSPSKGWIHPDANAESIPSAYARAGASAISILADREFFGGGLDDLTTARQSVNIPLLCKEFILDEYQLLQARLAGADAVLLIAACLDLDTCTALTSQAHALGLEVLLELHSPHELDYLDVGAEMVGINNRNLGSFHTDVANSFQLGQALQEAANLLHGQRPVFVSESGIAQPQTIAQLRQAGFRGFLIGETFMRTAQPAETLKQFINALHQTAQP